MKQNLIKRINLIAAITVVALLFSYLEVLLPITAMLPLPGFKLGLANIITILALTMMPLKDVFCVVLVRCILMALLFTGAVALILSLSGSLSSMMIMWLLLKKRGCFSLIGISVAGACIHNTGQLIAAGLITGTGQMLAPAGTADRAQSATILWRFTDLTE